MALEPRTPGPEHPISVEPSRDRVVVRVGEAVVAESSRAVVLRESTYPAVYYLPAEDVDWTTLRSSATSTYCPYKGEAAYYDAVTDEGVTADAAWSYPEPYPAVGEIAGRLAFYPDRTRISVEAAS